MGEDNNAQEPQAARDLYDLAGVLQGLYQWGLDFTENDDPGAWLSQYVESDEDSIKALSSSVPRHFVDEYITASASIAMPPGSINRLVFKKLEPLRGKIEVLRKVASMIATGTI